jgi:hypothetical protein
LVKKAQTWDGGRASGTSVLWFYILTKRVGLELSYALGRGAGSVPVTPNHPGGGVDAGFKSALAQSGLC